MKHLLLSLSIFSLLTLLACNKDSNCYDRKMKENHSGICSQDCPGVCGCNGQTYCNECIANSNGIKVIKKEPCK
ncbi:MAG: hypothetical protein HND27_10250 [Bacteroidetes bacterium]|nr:hypothetical protein [Flavobacteriales bacterium]NOG96143.1 hypothetical protein [Bacteroidota bacterium]WKZ75439.1 MAG: hypothetical protein QY303_00805 [Vicingaceae bacterium]